MTEARSSNIDVIPLDEAHVDAAARTLARAFADDPMWVYIEPDAARRAELLPAFMGANVRYARLHRTALVTHDVDGVVLWLPPSPPDLDPDGSLSGFDAAERLMTADAHERYEAYMAHLAPLRPATPYAYVMLIGVEPAAQRGGVGSALLKSMFARTDADGAPCYLETERPENVQFYEANGFRLDSAGEFRGLHYWTLLRPPAGG